MSFKDTNVLVCGARNYLDGHTLYTTVIPKPTMDDNRIVLTQDMMSKKNTKYIIKWNFVLGEDITVPKNCLIEFDGGSISNDNGENFSFTGQDTYLLFDLPIEEVLAVPLLGTFIYGAEKDKLDNTDGMAKIYLKSDKSFAEQVDTHLGGKPNTIYVIRYDFTLDGNVTLPENCVLEFDGGSISGGTITFTNTLLAGVIDFDINTVLVGKIKNTVILWNWFGAKGDGVTDDILPIQKAIDTCFTLENINTVSAIEGKYLISKPINLNGTVGVQRHNVCIKGQSMPFSSFRKGVQILGNTGTSMLECIDGVNNVIENIDFTSYTEGNNPSTIGIVVSRGDLQYVAKFTMRNCYINVGYYSENSRLYNNGFGSIGLYLNDAEESIFENVEVMANCCLGLANSNALRYYDTDNNRLPTTAKTYSYMSFYEKTITSISNTVYRFNECRLLSIGKISPAIILMSSSSVYMKGTFAQNALWNGNNGNCNYGILISAIRNSVIESTFEGYGTVFVLESTIENSKILANLDGRYNNGNGDTGEDNNGLMYFIEPDAAERNCWNNTIQLQSNNLNAPIIGCTRSYVTPFCLTKFINCDIRSNTKNTKIVPAFAAFYKDNDIYLNDVCYLNTGIAYGKLISQNFELGSVDESKYIKVWEYVVGDGNADMVSSNNHIEDVISLQTGGMGVSPSSANYILKVVCDIFNQTGETTPSFGVSYSFEPISNSFKYSSHSFESAEPFIVYDNANKKVMCYLKIIRHNPANNMMVFATQEITYTSSVTQTDRQILVTTEQLDSLPGSAATRQNLIKYGTTKPLLDIGGEYFDKVLNRPVWWSGDTNVGNNGWVDIFDRNTKYCKEYNSDVILDEIDLTKYYPLFIYETDGSIPDTVGSAVNILHKSFLTCGSDTMTPSPSSTLVEVDLCIVNISSSTPDFGVEYSYKIGKVHWKYYNYRIVISDLKVVYNNTTGKVVCLVKFKKDNVRISNRINTFVRNTNVMSGYNLLFSPSSFDDTDYTDATLLKQEDENKPTVGSTTDRPSEVPIGYRYFDETLGKPIYWNGTEWVDATGTPV